jgi:CheY-like chemotaxis protein
MKKNPLILLIEDNAPLRENIKILLRLSGYEVEAFDCGHSALETLKKKRPDLVLSDILLPGMTGYEILNEVRKIPACSDIPFIFLSALGEQDHIREGMSLGANDYVTKPFTSNDLIATIQSWLNRNANPPGADPLPTPGSRQASPPSGSDAGTCSKIIEYLEGLFPLPALPAYAH